MNRNRYNPNEEAMRHENANVAAIAPTCGTCEHWKALAAGPLPPGPVDLSMRAAIAMKRGECRESPPSMTQLPQPQGQLVLCGYPNIEESFPACSRHKGRVSLAVAEG